MSLAPYVHAMGRGPSRGRSLTEVEAADAMTQMLAGEAAPEAIGALLMLMRYRGETAAEVAGFTRAARTQISGWNGVGAALDWPSYAAGRSRGLPWFLLSAMLIGQAGHPVLLHGWNSYQSPVADVRRALAALSIRVADTPDYARAALGEAGLCYVLLENLCPKLLELLKLRDVLGLRSAVNTVCRMLNPAGASTMVQGVFHPPYRALQQEAGALLGQRNLMVLKGGGGEFERHPAKDIMLYGLADGEAFLQTAEARTEAHRKLAEPETDLTHLVAVWRGDLPDSWAEEIVIGTAAAAMMALKPGLSLEAAEAEVQALWEARDIVAAV